MNRRPKKTEGGWVSVMEKTDRANSLVRLEDAVSRSGIQTGGETSDETGHCDTGCNVL